MSNTITIELCAEDRKRLDTIIDALLAQIERTDYTIDRLFSKGNQTEPADEVTKALAKAIEESKPSLEEVAEATKNAQEATEENNPPTIPTKDETPTQAEKTEPTKATREVSRAELGAKVREMMTKGFKEETKAIVKDYAPTVPGVPEEKVAECYERLVALGG